MIARDNIQTGQIAVKAEATQLPSISSNLVKLKAASTNSGSVYIGSSAVAKPGGSANNTTAGFELAAGEETGWLPISNLHFLYMIGSDGDKLLYLSLI